MAHRTLLAVGIINAATTNIPANAPVVLPLFDTQGNAISGNKLPGSSISSFLMRANVAKDVRIFHGLDATPTTFEEMALSSPMAMDVGFSPGMVMGIQAVDSAAITVGVFVFHFYS